MRVQVFEDPVVLVLGPVPITRTALTSLAISLALLALALIVRQGLRKRPDGRIAEIGELAVSWIDDLVEGVVGHTVPWLVTFAGSLFFFIAACAVAGQLPGVRPRRRISR